MTDFLFARPSVIEGIGRNIDLFGALNVYNTSLNGDEADKKAIVLDYFAIYKDLYKAYSDTVCQIESKKTDV